MVNPRWACWVALGILVLITSYAHAQQAGSIRGMVYDKDFEAPLPVAQVQIVETGASTTTTDQGNYVLTEVPPGTYTLVFSKDGYARQVKGNVVVPAGQLVEVDAQLSGDFEEMDEFVVQDVQIGGGTEIGLLELRAQSPSLLDSIGADMISRAGASDAADAINFVAGATVQDGKFAVIRGLPDRYVNSQMNGVRLPSADDETRAVELDQFPAAIIESVQVSKTFTPDQQGDASGGAVNVVLKGVPDEFVFQVSSQVSYNTNVSGRDDFLSYRGGGLTYFGFNEDDNRQIQSEWYEPPQSTDPASPNDGFYDGAVGVKRTDAPIDYKYGVTIGGKHDLEDGVRIGGLASFFYERDSSGFRDGVDDEYVYQSSTRSLVPKRSLERSDAEFLTNLYDLEQSSQEVKWGGLGVLGVETENHELKLAYLYTRAAQDTVTLAEDTRGKYYFFPTYDPDDVFSDGNLVQGEGAAAPFRRNETLEYSERTTQTLQFSGRHTLAIFDLETADDTGAFRLLNPEFDWLFAMSEATYDEPDKRLFGSIWRPGINLPQVPPPFNQGSHGAVLPGNNINLGNVQRTFRDISEQSQQYQLNFKFPFEQWSDSEGYLKVGVFNDQVEREYDQETFSNPAAIDGGTGIYGDFDELWSEVFPTQRHYFVDSPYDTDYTGEFNVEAAYWMVDLPLTSFFNVIGGIRYESTEISTEVSPDVLENGQFGPVYYPPNSQTPTAVDPDEVNVDFAQEDALPAIGFIWQIFEPLTLRGSYTETVARQTFRELTPIQQQEYLGGPVFVGNPALQMSALKNYDLRLDYAPQPGSLVSLSYFYKDIALPIEYINQATADAGSYTTAVNYPDGELSGLEIEVRQDLGSIWENFYGLSIGGNATFISSEVRLPRSEINAVRNISGPHRTSRDATNAPEMLYNLYLIYNLESTGTEFALFYTVRGDTLVAGGGVGDSGYIPDVYETEYGTLNFSVTQKIGDYVKIKFAAKNLTDPDIQEVYRLDGEDTLKTSYTKGIDFSIGISAEIPF